MAGGDDIAVPRFPSWFQEKRGFTSKAQKTALVEVWPRFGRSEQARTLRFGELVDLDEWFGAQQGSGSRWLDIGFGNGDSLVQLASAKPEDQFLGCEVYRTGHALVAMACDAQDIANIRLVGGDARKFLVRQCPDQSFDVINIFFPDPFKEFTMRLVDAKFIEILSAKSKDSGRINFATDVWTYCKSVLVDMSSTGKSLGWKLVSICRSAGPQDADADSVATVQRNASKEISAILETSYDQSVQLVKERPEWRPETHFERQAIKERRYVWDIVFERSFK